jgi:WD40 repeat protein
VANEELQNLLRTGIQAAQSGNKAIARRILEQVTEQDPRNELAWIWMASIADSAAERRTYLQKVLEINPQNERARQALDKLEQAAPAAPLPPGPALSARMTPRVDQPPPALSATPSSGLGRDALLESAARRRRSPLPFLLVGLLAVAMIVVGVVLLLNSLLAGTGETTPTPATAALLPPRQTPLPAFVTSTPLGGTLITLVPQEPPPPTWTSTATWTPAPAATPTVTPLPPSSYTLMVSAKRGGSSEWALYTLQADGSGEQPVRLQSPAAAGGNPSAPTVLEVYDSSYSPDGQQIAFSARISEVRTQDNAPVTVEYEEIFTARASGGPSQRLTSLEATNTEDPAWSPDGQQIAFASDADGDFDIYVVRPGDEAPPRAMTFNSAQDRQPAWSPDGKAIAFASDQGGPGFLEVWRVSIDGTDLEQLTEDSNSSYAPAWSPDGKWIAFVSDRRVDADLYIMNADGTGEQLLTINDGKAEERDPAWSPDGEWIALSSNRNSPVFELALLRPDGSDWQPITSKRGGDTRYACWKP